MDRELAQRHPNVTVERDPIYVLDRGVYTSAGSTAALVSCSRWWKKISGKVVCDGAVPDRDQLMISAAFL